MTFISEMYKGFNDLFQVYCSWKRGPFPVTDNKKNQRGLFREAKMTGG